MYNIGTYLNGGSMKKIIREGDERELLLYAFRYALTRNSMAIVTVTEALKRAWEHLNEWEKTQYVQEILFELDHGARPDKTSRAHWRKFLKESGHAA